jgi:hypothetical protein
MSTRRPHQCANCGTALTGEYCARCGQRERGSDPGLGDLLREVLEDFGRLDGRVWRTLLRLVALEEFFREQVGEDGLQPAWFNALIERLIRNASLVGTDTAAFKAQLLQRLPQMMFFLLPLFALILQLAYLMSPFHYLQHLIFSLHFHTAAFIYFILLYPARWLLPGDFGGVVMLALLVYLPIAMVRTYGSGWLAAVGKSFGVGLVYYLLVLISAVVYILVNLALVQPA